MDGLFERKAGEVMTVGPKAVTRSTLAGEALKLMNDSRITVLFVVEAGAPVGILHVHDVLRAGVI
jgi:arabinose-5-phosphate isomerase